MVVLFIRKPQNRKVLLVDDHGIVRSGLRVMLEAAPGFEIVGEASNGRDGVAMASMLDADVVIMDVRMPEMNGIESTRQITRSGRGTNVIGLSAFSDQRTLNQMFQAGARGFVLKSAAFEELCQAIDRVVDGGIYISPAIEHLMQFESGATNRLPDSPFDRLSAREREVLQLIAEGRAIKEVAMLLKVSIKTAESHRRNLMAKLSCDGVAELTKYAIREGLTDV